MPKAVACGDGGGTEGTIREAAAAVVNVGAGARPADFSPAWGVTVDPGSAFGVAVMVAASRGPDGSVGSGSTGSDVSASTAAAGGGRKFAPRGAATAVAAAVAVVVATTGAVGAAAGTEAAGGTRRSASGWEGRCAAAGGGTSEDVDAGRGRATKG